MKSFTIRFDMEVEAKNKDGAGEFINNLIVTAVDVVECEHYRWALTEGGLDNPDTEKNLRQAILREG